MDHLLPPSAVTRRCLPALGTMKGGVVVVGNETVFDDGEGVTVNASDVLEASKWVLPTTAAPWTPEAFLIWSVFTAGFSMPLN